MSVQIIEFFHSLIDDVVTEFSEGDVSLSTIFLQQFLELGMRVIDFEMPFGGQQRHSISEFSLGDSPLPVDVNGLEVLPELVVELEVDEEELEFGPGHIVVSEGVSRFDLVLGGLVSPHDGWLSLEQFRQLQDVSDAFVDFCQGQVHVTIHIKISEKLLSLGDVLLRGTNGDLCGFLLDVCATHLVLNLFRMAD